MQIEMKKNIISFFLILLVITATVSCSDEFINEEAPFSIDSENYFNSDKDYYNALVAAYDMLHSSYVNVLL